MGAAAGSTGRTAPGLTARDADQVLAATQTGAYESRDAGKTYTELAPLTS
ncbi:hypothetical protein [Streptomyces phaeochromogenes]|nr:hypothetical protein OHB08_50185 [Streptomyces phaeochromogenes]